MDEAISVALYDLMINDVLCTVIQTPLRFLVIFHFFLSRIADAFSLSSLPRCVQLMGPDPLFLARHEVRGLKPLAQLDAAALEERSNRHGELALAG
jgi:hypothetical protein